MIMKIPPKTSDLSTTVWRKENPAYYLMQDANEMLRSATDANRESDVDRECSFSRLTVLLYALAAEAFINMVYEYSQSPTAAHLQQMSVRRKWLRASIECLPHQGRIENEEGQIVYKPGDKIETFEPNSKLFLSYIELKKIRDDFVHLKPVFRAVPVEEFAAPLHGKDIYPHTGIPKSLSLWRVAHAEIAKGIFHQMVEKLNEFMKGMISRLLESPALIEMEESTYIEYFETAQE
jgi:hypothetical protein